MLPILNIHIYVTGEQCVENHSSEHGVEPSFTLGVRKVLHFNTFLYGKETSNRVYIGNIYADRTSVIHPFQERATI